MLYFVHEIKRENDTVTKGIVVSNTFEAARQTYHAYLGAYAYGHQPGCDFVSCLITDQTGVVRDAETWNAAPVD